MSNPQSEFFCLARGLSEQWFYYGIVLSQPCYDLWRYFIKITIWISKEGKFIGVDLYVGKHDNTGVPNLECICLSEGIHLTLGIQGKNIFISYFFQII